MDGRPQLLNALALISVLCPSMAVAGDFSAYAQKAFSPVIENYKIPGLVVGVTRNGVHEFYTAGLASRADNRPVTPDTLFELGSISKVFTVTLAALAEQRGKLNLNDTLAHHLCEDACSIGNNLTLMDLATHHSGGLPLQVPDSVENVEGLINWLKDWQPSHPGARSYSNISIGMLGYISGKAMGSNYPKAAQTVLFPALGLTNTWINVPDEKMPLYAYGYDRKTDAPIRVSPGVLDAEAYGVKSSARDMLKLLDIELGEGETSAEIKAAVERTQQGQFKTDFFTQAMILEQYPWPVNIKDMLAGNGYDFIMKPQPVQKITPSLPAQRQVLINKTGSTNGFGGYIAAIPSEKLGIVVLANKNYPNEARIEATYSLIQALLKQ